jgi:hypothetical protein
MTSSKNQVTVTWRSPGKTVACAVERPRDNLHNTCGSVGLSIGSTFTITPNGWRLSNFQLPNPTHFLTATWNLDL